MINLINGIIKVFEWRNDLKKKVIFYNIMHYTLHLVIKTFYKKNWAEKVSLFAELDEKKIKLRLAKLFPCIFNKFLSSRGRTI